MPRAMRKATLTVEVAYDESVTDAESLATAADRLLETALSTPGILDEYASDRCGNPRFGEFLVLSDRQARAERPVQTGRKRR